MDFPKQENDKPLKLIPYESDIRKRCDNLMKKRGAYICPVNQDERGSSGAPDRVYCYKGMFIAVEYKRSASEKASRLQLHHKDMIRSAGGKWYLIWSSEQLELEMHILEGTINAEKKK